MDLTRRQQWIVFGLAFGILVFSAWRFDGPSRGYWDTYITVPAMFMTGQPVDLRRIDGTPRFKYALKGRVPDDTYDPTPGSFGIASKDQRIGAAILFGGPFALFNKAAFRWIYAVSWSLMFLFAFLSYRRLTDGFAVPLAAALILVLNPFSLFLDRLNGNQLGLFVMVFLWFLMTEKKPRWWLIGLLYGVLGGIRNEAIILGPMFLAFQWRDARALKPFLVRLGSFTAFAFITILPVLLWNRFAYGQMIIHPSQVAHLEGFRPTFTHSFFGTTFQFNGLLNYPFHDHVVRTPHFAFPTFLMWPLVTIKSLGVVLTALAAIGTVVLFARRRFEASVLLFWYCIVALLFFFQENWEELKQTFMALHMFPLVAFVAAGLAWLGERMKDWKRWALVVVVAAAFAVAVLAARGVQAPADERWYVRFPHAATSDSGLAELPEELRKDWQFFYTHETEAEIRRERM
ncbi:MAG: DUF2029 domain-containing protein, partial [Deltaproteobacteria bacterium]|nr:DUF2029 domain-containing protein [Deltaproteobacteria bacterium]